MKFCNNANRTKYPNFFINRVDWLDRALDGEHGHAGPKTHQAFTEQLIKFLDLKDYIK